MGSYKGTLQSHFKTPFALTDTFTFREWALCNMILENSCLLADIVIFRDIFRGHLKSGETSNKLASKTCIMSLGRTKISKNQARKLAVKSGSKSVQEKVPKTTHGFCEITS